MRKKGPSRIRTGDGGFAIRNRDDTSGADVTTSGDGPSPVALPVAPTDPELARIVAAWPDLPDAIRRAMLALVGAPTTR
jgi:hypothetical protein